MDNLYEDQDSNPWPPKYEAQEPTTFPQCLTWTQRVQRETNKSNIQQKYAAWI